MTKIFFPEQENKYLKELNLFFFRKYKNFKKLFNLFKGIIAEKKKSILLNHLPYIIYIDPTNICPLRCPLCPTGLRLQGRKTGFMKFSTCKKIIDQLKDSLFFVRLYNWGEPLLNPEIFKMIDYISSNKIGSIISTNLLVDKEILGNLVNSSLDYLIVSLDGTSKISYEKYRKGGDFEKVLKNLKILVQLNPSFKIEWLFIINKYNQKEMDEAKHLAKELKIDILHFSPTFDCLSASKMNDRGKEIYKEFKIDYSFPLASYCNWIYSRMVFNWDGSVAPCCALDDSKFDFGNIFKNSVEEIWNNKKYQLARKIFKYNLKHKYPNFICSRCIFIK